MWIRLGVFQAVPVCGWDRRRVAGPHASSRCLHESHSRDGDSACRIDDVHVDFFQVVRRTRLFGSAHADDRARDRPSGGTSYGRVTSTHGRVTSTYAGVTSTHDRVTSTYDRVTSTHGRVTSTYAGVTSTYGRVTPTYERVTAPYEKGRDPLRLRPRHLGRPGDQPDTADALGLVQLQAHRPLPSGVPQLDPMDGSRGRHRPQRLSVDAARELPPAAASTHRRDEPSAAGTVTSASTSTRGGA